MEEMTRIAVAARMVVKEEPAVGRLGNGWVGCDSTCEVFSQRERDLVRLYLMQAGKFKDNNISNGRRQKRQIN